MSSRPVLVIRVRMIRNDPGNARVCPGLRAPMLVTDIDSDSEHIRVEWLRGLSCVPELKPASTTFSI